MTRKTTDTSAAERAVAAFEACALGEPYAAPREAARAALNALRSDAMDQLSRFEPWGADVNADFDRIIATMKRQELAALLVAIMPQCLASYPKMARFLVSPPILELVRSCNETPGAPDIEGAVQLEYLQAQSAHLIGHPDYEPAATVLVESVKLAERCRVAEERHEAHQAAELARIGSEQAEAAEAIAAEDRRRRAIVAEFFGTRGGQRFMVHGRMFSGAGLSQSVSRGAGLRDTDDGELSKVPTIDELEIAMHRAQAAEAVTA